MLCLLFYYGFAMKNLKGGDNILQMHKLAIWNDINASKIQNSMYNLYFRRIKLKMRGLCFCGGGIKVASHIGALKALEEKNIKKSLIYQVNE